MTTNSVPKVTELTFPEIIREEIVTFENITKEEAARRREAQARRPANQNCGRWCTI